MSGSDGGFNFSGLAPGRYTVVFHVDLIGFQHSHGGVEVSGNHISFIDERLDLSKVTGALSASIEVGRDSRLDLRFPKRSTHSRGETIMVATRGAESARSMAHSWLVPPTSRLEVGTTLSFVTAPPAGGGQTLPGMTATQLRFSDVVLFGLSARYSINGKVELHGGATLLPKQPLGESDLVFQGATAGGRLAIGKHFAADLDLGGGPLLGDQGAFGTAQAAFRGKATVDRWRTITFEGAVGGDATDLFRSRTAVGATGTPPASDAWFS